MIKHKLKQRAAFHEASHALAMVQNGIPIRAIHFEDSNGLIYLYNGSVKDNAVACIEAEKPYWPYDFLDEECPARRCAPLHVLLAGMAAEKKMRPWLAYNTMISSGLVETDWNCAVRYAANLNPVEPAALAKSLLRPIRTWVIAEWPRIVRIGEALLASDTLSVSGEAVAALIS